MSVIENQDLKTYCEQVAARARAASQALATLRGETKIRWLQESAAWLREQTPAVLAANVQDVEAAPGFGLTDAQTDRLRLDESRVEDIATGLEAVAALPDPVGEIIESSVRPNGLQIQKTRVPLGVIFFVYESRPNVTADAAALCVKSGNAVILRGGKEAAHSSRAIVDILNEVGQEVGLPNDAVQLVSTTDRDAVGHFLGLNQYIDLAIPRGGEGLIRRVASEATMPVMKHFSGNCHVYVDAAADLDMAHNIVVNSKCHRMGVCNAAESLVVHALVAAEFLPRLGATFAEKGVEIRGDERVRELIPAALEVTDEDYGTEYLGPTISACVAGSLDEAVEHINRYSSGHTESIVTGSLDAAREFIGRIDSAAVMVNASTRFNDGGEFGLGAEIGISTDKFHARGPCGLTELTSYKYVVFGKGQVR